MATNPLFASEEETRAVVGLMGLASPRVLEQFEFHVVEYGELLATVLLGDLAKTAFTDTVDEGLLKCVNWLLVVGSASVRNVLLTGFVEGVPLDVDDGEVQRLPNPLRNEVQRDLGRPET